MWLNLFVRWGVVAMVRMMMGVQIVQWITREFGVMPATGVHKKG